jgi:hypothetical protein
MQEEKELHVEVISWAHARVIAQKSMSERAEMIFSCQRLARSMMEAGERLRHPELSDEQISQAVSRRILRGSV